MLLYFDYNHRRGNLNIYDYNSEGEAGQKIYDFLSRHVV